jgi:glycosyltransferase involved in cell wall biosynthesis
VIHSFHPRRSPRPGSVMVLAPFFPPAVNGGGPIRSLAALVSRAPSHWRVMVCTSDTDLGASQPLDVPREAWTDRSGREVFFGDARTLRGTLRLWREALNCDAEVLYLNSFFNWRFSLVPQLLAMLPGDRPSVILASRGEFGQGALSRRSQKKRVLIRLYMLMRMHRRVTFHASTHVEAADIQRVLGHGTSVIVRKNDTMLTLKARATSVPPKCVLTFVGRVVPHKGLRTLLEAMELLPGSASLDIFGAEEDAVYARACRALAEALPHRITFHGSQDHSTIMEALVRSSFMCLPTAGENFGHAIAEALSVSCPVVVSDTTPWSEPLTRHRGGSVVSDHEDAHAWARALNALVNEDDATARERRRAAAETFDEWQGDQPPHVFDLWRSSERGKA